MKKKLSYKIPIGYRPSISEVEAYLRRWQSLDNYVNQEHALDKLFLYTFTDNSDLDNILIKCSTLNDFYSTNIFDIHSVAQHIYKLNIDQRLKNGDLSLVNDIAHVKVGENSSPRFFYSFATKYCSHHQPLKYAIYDSYVEKVFVELKNRDKFSIFKRPQLKDYCTYMRVVKDFQQFYQLEQYNIKQLDQYLWQMGKDYFKKY
jgi:hypothetical protein